MKTVESLTKDLFSVKGKVVLVTGAAGQLGTAIRRAFGDSEARVVGVDQEQFNLADPAAIKAAFDETFEREGRVDVLINNAGVSVFEPFEERSEESFDAVTGVNLKGTFFCIQNYVRNLRQRGLPGSIINIASIYGVISPDFRIYTDCSRINSEVYGASKAGIIQMTKYFAVRLAQDHVRVNCISPGGIFNPENPQGEDFQKRYAERCPMGRMAKAEEMVGAMIYLASEASSYMTGQNLVIDGGMSSW